LSQVNRFIQRVDDLYDLLDQTAKPCVAVLGSFNSGKSTLVNGLLGAEVSPVGVVPTTNCLIAFDYGQTFKASYTGAGQNLSFGHMDQLRSFLISGLKNSSGRVFIEHPAPLLKKCRLVDTPGIDGSPEAGLIALQAATEADHVIYLFHQRGIEDLNRLFLYRLSDIWKKKDLNKLSFWLNCNHGLCDGSSFDTTRAVLREIFLSPVRCNTINTRDPAGVETVNQLLQVELARDACRQASSHLKKLDQELPGRILKVARLKEDSAFLSEFWRVQETSRFILETKKILHSLPAVAGELEHNLTAANLANLGAGQIRPGGRVYRPQKTGITESRNKLLALTAGLLAEKTIEGLINLTAVDNIAREIEAERFTIAALGGFSTGKTTFFNALLKEDLLPAADGPTTTAVTRITYGPNKKATVHLPLQITLSICEQVGEKVGIYREQLQALERWLAPGTDIVASVECSTRGSFQLIDRQELLKRLQHMKEHFAAGAFARTAANSRLPGVFKLISRKAYQRNPFPGQVRVTFKEARSVKFDLSEQSGREQFREALGPKNAFRMEQVVVEHPSEFLRHADFLDTPGLDWIQKHHHQKTAYSIRHSDAYLVFLNGKHILNQMDRQNLQALFLPGTGAGLQNLTDREREKYYFVINFADILNPAEQEAVCNFVRRNLGVPYGKYTPASGAPNIFLISALKALSGAGVNNIGTLLKALEEGLLKHRAKDFYLDKIAALLGVLDEASLRASKAYLERNTSGSMKVKLRKARETLRQYRKRLKEIRSWISPAKPP
jgi:hypothetical protein